MPVRMRSAGIVLASAALAAATGLAAVPASAAVLASAAPKTWTISPGGAVAVTTKSFTVEDITAGGSLPCGSAAGKAKFKSGKGLSGTDAGTLTSVSVTGCGLDGFAVTIKAGHLPWHLNLLSYKSAKGVTTATLTGIHLTLAVPAVGCTGVVDGTKATADDGTVQVTYTNKTGQLTTLKTGGKLHLYNVQNCEGVVSNGDSVAILASFSVRPKQQITSR